MSDAAHHSDGQPDSELERFIAVFFGDGNEIDLAVARDFLLPWVDRLRRTPRSASILFRKRTPKNQSPVYQLYILPFNRHQAHELTLQITAFLGDTFSSFRGLRSPLDLADPIEAEVHRFTGGNAFRFRIDTSTDDRKTQVFQRLAQMRALWDQQPESTGTDARPLDQVLRDFFMALAAGNRESATYWIQWLTDHAMLDASNLLFLHVQMLGTLRADEELLQHAELPLLMHMRRPPAVTQALLEAVFRRYLSVAVSASEARKLFTEQVRAQFTGLLGSRIGIQSAEARCCLALNAASEPADWAAVNDLASDVPPTAAGTLLSAIAKLAPNKASPSLSPQELMARGDTDALYSAALRMQPGVERCICLLRCASDTTALETRSEALRALGEVPSAQRAEVARAATSWLEWLKIGDDAPQPAPRDWREWLARLNQNGPWAGAVEVAAAGAAEWAIGPTDNDLQTLLLESRNGPASVVFDRSLPHFVRWLKSDTDWPRPSFRDLYEAVLTCLLSIARPTADDLTVISSVIAAVMETGAQSPNELLAEAVALMDRVRGPRHLNWALELVDVFLEQCGEPTSLYTLLEQLEKWFRAFPARVSPSQWAVASALAFEIGQANWAERLRPSKGRSLNDEAEADTLKGLDGVSVLIYTMTRGAGERARKIIMDVAPSARVTLSNDTVATPRLKDAAAQARYVVLTSRSATHAATDALKAASDSDRIVYALGKGCASIVAALRNAVENQGTQRASALCQSMAK
jgi:hypothetical protein